ncbi:glycosyltransferase family A protein [Acinetobacter puyangensis]|uniref:Glycosyl transferase family 2 n=1 Tax=Acinetobacter puyangensis TaxID=1096779 RepID=A0A240E770_9GAMM|nr:glycosyltransferase [Acinetobacter puyangensis]SNX43745.1 Glycosyl transferase family 2 [Acinetobacter puyangensis]
MIGIVIPAHNEETDLPACIHAMQIAIDEIGSLAIDVRILVVLDNCTDQSLNIIQQAGIDYLQCDAQCVGIARDLGIRQMIATGAQWIACTDADSRVDRYWLQQQLQHQPTDVICGVIELDCWQHLSQTARKKYLSHYQDRMDHRHIHGANLSFSATAYLQVGGFEALTCHEDVGLIQRFLDEEYQIIWSNLVRVTTSSRLNARAPNGLSAFLKQLEA